MRRIAAATSFPCEQPPARPCGRYRLPPRRPDLSPSPRAPLYCAPLRRTGVPDACPSLPPSLRTPRRPAAARRCAHLCARCHPRPPCADDAALRTTRLAARRRSAAGAQADADSARRAAHFPPIWWSKSCQFCLVSPTSKLWESRPLRAPSRKVIPVLWRRSRMAVTGPLEATSHTSDGRLGSGWCEGRLASGGGCRAAAGETPCTRAPAPRRTMSGSPADVGRAAHRAPACTASMLR